MTTGQGPKNPPDDPADDWFGLLDDAPEPLSVPTTPSPAPVASGTPATTRFSTGRNVGNGTVGRGGGDPPSPVVRARVEDISRKVTPVVLTPMSDPPLSDNSDDVWNWEVEPTASPRPPPASQPAPPPSQPAPSARPSMPDMTFGDFDDVDFGELPTMLPREIPVGSSPSEGPPPPPHDPYEAADFDLDDAESWQFDPTATSTAVRPPVPQSGIPTALVPPSLPPSARPSTRPTTPPSARPTALRPPPGDLHDVFLDGPSGYGVPGVPPSARPRKHTMAYSPSARPTPLVPADVPPQAMPTPLVPPPMLPSSTPLDGGPSAYNTRTPHPRETPQHTSREAPPRTPRTQSAQRPASVQVPPPQGVPFHGSSRTAPVPTSGPSAPAVGVHASSSSTVPVPAEAPVSRREMHERFDLGDFTGALNTAEAMLAADPGDADARGVADVSRSRLRAIYAGRLGSLHQVPVMVVPGSELRWLSLDHRAGFVLSLIDGVSTLEEIIDVSAMSPLEVLRTLYNLTTQRVIMLRPGRR